MNNEEIWKAIKHDRAIRRNLCYLDFSWFFHLMLNNYVKYQTAPFQINMMRVAQDPELNMVVITAFRGSAKSTIFTLALPLWSIFGIFQYKYVAIICQNQARAQQSLINIRRELEENKLLINDIGPFEDKSNIWNNDTIELKRFSARISVFSINEPVRSLKYRENRPQLIIYDDLEDTQSAKTAEARDNLWHVIKSEIIPSGDLGTRNIFIGNLIHEDSIMMRFKKQILEKEIDGVYYEYPIVDADNTILWPGKFRSLEDVEKVRRTIGSDLDYLREFMLKIVPSTDQVIPKEWIKFYHPSELPGDDLLEYIVVSIDPAISTGDAACKTGIVILRKYLIDDQTKIYVDRYCVNRKMNLDDAITELKNIQSMFSSYNVEFVVEGAGMQADYAQALQREGIPAEVVKIGGQDKHARLMNVSMMIKNQTLFAKHGNDEIINQVIYFDASKYFDLLDALTLGLKKISMDDDSSEPSLVIAECLPDGNYRLM
jgi:hypothetical protein